MTMNQLMRASIYREKRFSPPRPALNTIKKWILEGEIPGKVINGQYFVEVEKEIRSTGNDLADKILGE